MGRPITVEEAAELACLWERLDLLKRGIGGHVLTLATAVYGSETLAEADRQARDLLNEAIEVRDRIRELTEWPPGPVPVSPPVGIRLGAARTQEPYRTAPPGPRRQ